MEKSFLIKNMNSVKNLSLMICGILSVTMLSCSDTSNPKEADQKNSTTTTITLKVQKITDTLEALTDMAFPESYIYLPILKPA